MRECIYLLLGLLLISCSQKEEPQTAQDNRDNYYQYEGTQKMNGGVKMVEISTPSGNFNVWTKQVGNNPDMKVLILHGGPGGNHFWYQSFNSYLPAAHIEYYYYDQLGSWFSDQPQDTSLWNTARFVDEVEQVRKALGLNKDNFYLYGHSWGGILAIEYALKYQQHLKGLIISNMMSSVPAYNNYADGVLAKQMDPDVLSQIKQFEKNGEYDNPKYMDLLMHNFYNKHILRMPVEQWPEPVVRGLNHLNEQIYVQMQGPSEFGITDEASLSDWDRTDDLSKIKTPTLVIGAKYDTMDPEFMKMMSGKFQNGRYLYCPNGSHMDMYDDQQTYFDGLIKFIKDVNAQKM